MSNTRGFVKGYYSNVHLVDIFEAAAREEQFYLGFTVANLVAHYHANIRRFVLACEMGESDVELPGSIDKENLIESAAEWIISLARVFPIPSEIGGIPIPYPTESMIDLIWDIYEQKDKSAFDPILVDMAKTLRSSYVAENLVDARPKILKEINPAYVSAKVMRTAIKKEPGLFKELSDIEKTQEICDIAVICYPSMIAYVPKDKINEFMVKEASISRPGSIGEIPAKFFTEDVILNMVEHGDEMVKKIPVEILDSGVVAFIISANPDCMNHLRSIGKVDADSLIKAVAKSGQVLQSFHKFSWDFTDEEFDQINISSVSVYPETFFSVPVSQRTAPVMDAAVRTDRGILKRLDQQRLEKLVEWRKARHDRDVEGFSP